MTHWATLGIEPTNDIRAIKKAYSVQLKTTRPDDDAAAYQQLREAYEAAQWLARNGLATDADAEQEALDATPADPVDAPLPAEPSPQAGEASPPAEVVIPVEAAPAAAQEDTLVLQPGPTLERLLQTCAAILEQGGEVHFVRLWPGLQQQLEDLPIAAHLQANRGFAEFVLQHAAPVEVLIALTRHFQWGLDYRVDQQLGPQLATALQERLQQAHVYVAFSQRDAVDAWPLALARLWDRKRELWVRWLALCLDSPTRQRVLQVPAARLQALGMSRAASGAVAGAATAGGLLQLWLFAALFAGAAIGLHWLSGSSQPWGLVFAAGLGALLAMLFHAYLYQEFPDLDRWWPALRRWLSVPPGVLDGVVAVPLVAAVVLHWADGNSALQGLGVLLSMVYFAIWIVVPTDEQPWRKLALPVFGVLLLGLQGLFPSVSAATALSLAMAWVLAAQLVLRRFPEVFEAWYENFVKLRFLLKVPLLFLGIKFVLIVWALAVLVCLPVFLFRLLAYRGILYAYLAVVAGVVLSVAFSTPGKETQWLLGCVLVAVFAIQLLQDGLQQLADVCLRKLQA